MHTVWYIIFASIFWQNMQNEPDEKDTLQFFQLIHLYKIKLFIKLHFLLSILLLMVIRTG